MDGPEAAKAIIDAYLAAAVPPQLDAIAAALNLGPRGPKVLPNPKLLPPAEVAKLSIEQFPALISSILDTVNIERVDADLADLEDLLVAPQATTGTGYLVTYVARVFGFARGADYDDTNATRFRYALALRQAILGRPSLATAGVVVNEATWRESYSDLERDARRTIGAFYVEFRLTVAEDLVVVEPNWVDTLEVITVTMPTGTAETA